MKLIRITIIILLKPATRYRMNDIFMYTKHDYRYQVYDDEHQESRLKTTIIFF